MSVTVLSVSPVPWLTIVIWAAEMTAPLGSITVPNTAASSLCDQAHTPSRENDRSRREHALVTLDQLNRRISPPISPPPANTDSMNCDCGPRIDESRYFNMEQQIGSQGNLSEKTCEPAQRDCHAPP